MAPTIRMTRRLSMPMTIPSVREAKSGLAARRESRGRALCPPLSDGGIIQEIFHADRDDGRLGGVRPVIFQIGDVVAGGLELLRAGAAGGLDRRLLVLAAMRDEDMRRAFLMERREEAGGKSEDVGHEIAIGDAVRQRIGAAVRMAGKGEFVGA